MNDLSLTGRIAKDLPNVEELTNRPLMLVLAVDKYVAGQKDVDFIPIKVWGKNAKNICQYKSKGDELLVKGRIGVGKYEKDGNKIYVLEVTANYVEFIGSRKKDVSQSQIDQANATSHVESETLGELNSIGNNNQTNVQNNIKPNTQSNIQSNTQNNTQNNTLSNTLSNTNNSSFNSNSDLGFSSKEVEEFILNAIGKEPSPF